MLQAYLTGLIIIYYDQFLKFSGCGTLKNTCKTDQTQFQVLFENPKFLNLLLKNEIELHRFY